MKFIYFFVGLSILISCHDKKPINTIQIPKIQVLEAGKIIVIDSVQLASIKDSCIIAFYRANNNRTFWLANVDRKKLITLFNKVEEEGLFKKDFDIKKIEKAEKNIHQLSDEELVNYDILLTQNLNKYIKKVSKGTVNPKELYLDWELKKNNINFKQMLLNFQKKEFFDDALKAVRPSHLVYKKLLNALKIINSLPKEEFNKIEIKHKIVLNDTNNTIIKIKKRLIYWKDLKQSDSLINIYDSITGLAVKKFQMRHGLAPDGVIGQGTVNALNITKQKRKEQIIVNLERWRWYPRQFEEEYLIINIPDYILHSIKKTDTTRTHKVIVGREDRKTPVLSSKLTHLIWNPAWTVPPTILKKDVIPATIRNRNYLTKKNISIYDASGNMVSIDNWSSKKANSYRYVQSPGVHNSLGLVKFMFPNRFSVYLHDTNSRGFFIQEIRSLSSGCIRVQDPFELAEYLLDDAENWNLDKMKVTINTGKTTKVNFNKDIYIHIFYWTAWSENGSLQFRDDLYNLDSDLYKKIKNQN